MRCPRVSIFDNSGTISGSRPTCSAGLVPTTDYVYYA
ncbi:hypothetical protein F443_10430 [Phytophthora nicotianae P1569]|uniref:Uncharacterized protein n=1 Tax=Phytophthora nicotianae P1569 TaxID=1317065 RepID=V9F052_PHYNI|nr:hypothetical protein F443_10430 [Phytophthora nicotianae P1569]